RRRTARTRRSPRTGRAAVAASIGTGWAGGAARTGPVKLSGAAQPPGVRRLRGALVSRRAWGNRLGDAPRGAVAAGGGRRPARAVGSVGRGRVAGGGVAGGRLPRRGSH